MRYNCVHMKRFAAFLMLPTLTLLSCASPSAPIAGVEVLSAAPEVMPNVSDQPTGEIIVSAAREASYKATYKITGTSENQRVNLQQTWYVRQDDSRLDIGNGYTLYRIDDQLYQCYALTTGATCLRLSAVQSAANRESIGQLQLELLRRLDELEVQYENERVVIGHPTLCLAMKPLPESDFVFKQATVCYNANGIPLFAKMTTPSAKLTMEAQSLNTSINASDLTLPAPVR
jgi:hypothetical protein